MGDICYPADTIWPVDATGLQPAEDATPEEIATHEERLDRAQALGWTTYQMLTGHAISICPLVVRPVSRRCTGLPTWVEATVVNGRSTPFMPIIIGGRWLNIWCGHDVACDCEMVSSVQLPPSVGGIEAIEIDGVALDPAAYRIDNGNILVRQDGGAWPLTQDFSKPAGEPGTWTVSLWQGIKPDSIDKMAAGVLAYEYLVLLRGGKKCRLPNGVRSVVRQGVSYEIEVDLFERGLTGIHEVDVATARRNPNRNRLASRLVVPRRGNRPRVTTVGR